MMAFTPDRRYCTVPGCTYSEVRGVSEGDFVKGQFVCPDHASIEASTKRLHAEVAERKYRPHLTINRRYMRTQQLLSHVMHQIKPYLDPDSYFDAARVLEELFYSSGVQIITDSDRAAAGLPPRDQNGMTLEELVIMEAHFRRAMLEGTFPILVTDTDGRLHAEMTNQMTNQQAEDITRRST